MRFASLFSVLLTLAGSPACAPPDVTVDAGQRLRPEADAGALLDAGRSSDAGELDAGPSPPGDAGPLDGGAISDSGPSDAGVIAVEGEACERNGSPRCDDGLFCLRPSAFTSTGVCHVECVERDAEGNVVGEAPSLCDEGTTCQTVTTPTLNILGVVCLPPVEVRDELCPAPEDADACAGDLVCSISASEVVLGALFVDEARCKVTCDASAATADAGCPNDETCLGPRSPLGDGVCGRAVPLWDGDAVPGPSQQCNERTGHDYCDDRPFRGLAEPAVLECVTGFYLDPHVGLCLATCSQPRFDYNSDGEIVDADGEAAFDLQCPSGFVCDQQRARDFGLIEPVVPEIPCDDFGCVPGELCPPCGPGAECALDFNSGTSICAAVYGFCVAGDISDAGPIDGG